MTVNMPKVAVSVTCRCNLKCKLCAAHSPYYKKPYHPDLKSLSQNIDRYFEIVDHVRDFVIGGGEPLLRKDLPQVVQKVHQYESRMNRLMIFTNGTIIPSDELIEELKKLEIQLYLVVDDYGPDKSVNALAAYKKFQEIKGASVVLRDYYSEDMHCGGWVDYGISADSVQKTPEEAKKLFAKCSQPQKLDFCVNVLNGKLYPCPPQRLTVELGLVEPDPSEVIDLFDSSQSDDSIRERISGLYNKDVLSACAYCNGLCDDSVRYPPAEQL